MKLGSDLALLVLRLTLGATMFVHGSQKLLGWFGGPGPHGFVGWMASMHVPALFAWIAIIAEFFGGIAVAAGVLANFAALAIAIEMLVGIRLVHWKVGYFMNWGGAPNRGEGWEYSIMVFAVAVAIALMGPGRLALLSLRRERHD